MLVLLGQRAHDAQGVVEVAVDSDDPRPAASAWSSLPSAIWPRGNTTMTSSPAAAPYAAADAEVLPVDAQTMARAPALDRLGDGHDHAAVLEAIRSGSGPRPSGTGSAVRSTAPAALPGSSGVAPSPRQRDGVASVIGRNRR